MLATAMARAYRREEHHQEVDDRERYRGLGQQRCSRCGIYHKTLFSPSTAAQKHVPRAYARRSVHSQRRSLRTLPPSRYMVGRMTLEKDPSTATRVTAKINTGRARCLLATYQRRDRRISSAPSGRRPLRQRQSSTDNWSMYQHLIVTLQIK